MKKRKNNDERAILRDKSLVEEIIFKLEFKR